MCTIHLDQLVPDIIQHIFDELDFITQLNLKLTSTSHAITNLLDNIPNEKNLTDEILKLYPNIIKLNIGSKQVTHIDHLVNLRILRLGSNSMITNDYINLLAVLLIMVLNL